MGRLNDVSSDPANCFFSTDENVGAHRREKSSQPAKSLQVLKPNKSLVNTAAGHRNADILPIVMDQSHTVENCAWKAERTDEVQNITTTSNEAISDQVDVDCDAQSSLKLVTDDGQSFMTTWPSRPSNETREEMRKSLPVIDEISACPESMPSFCEVSGSNTTVTSSSISQTLDNLSMNECSYLENSAQLDKAFVLEESGILSTPSGMDSIATPDEEFVRQDSEETGSVVKTDSKTQFKDDAVKSNYVDPVFEHVEENFSPGAIGVSSSSYSINIVKENRPLLQSDNDVAEEVSTSSQNGSDRNHNHSQKHHRNAVTKPVKRKKKAAKLTMVRVKRRKLAKTEGESIDKHCQAPSVPAPEQDMADTSANDIHAAESKTSETDRFLLDPGVSTLQYASSLEDATIPMTPINIFDSKVTGIGGTSVNSTASYQTPVSAATCVTPVTSIPECVRKFEMPVTTTTSQCVPKSTISDESDVGNQGNTKQLYITQESLVLPFDDEDSERRDTPKRIHSQRKFTALKVTEEQHQVTEPSSVENLVLAFEEECSERQESITIKTKRGRPRRRSNIFVKPPPISEDQISEDSKCLPPSSSNQDKLTVDLLSLPFDDEDPSLQPEREIKGSGISVQESSEAVDVKPKKKRKGRKSADFEIMNTILSPMDSNNSPDAITYMPLGQPQARRSGRLRRKSIEIYRATARQKREDNSEKTMLSEKTITSKTEEQASSQEQMEPVIGSDKLVDEKLNIHVEQSKEISNELSCESDSSSIPSPTAIEHETLNEECSTTSPVLESPVEDGNERKSRRTKKKQESVPEVCKLSPLKKSRKKKGDEPSIEDIYLNKLWRTQMPKEKIWETIFEQPVEKEGKEVYTSARRVRRSINSELFYTKCRLKKRRQKATKLGWKPLSLKREIEMTELLNEKMACLETDLESEELDMPCAEVSCAERTQNNSELTELENEANTSSKSTEENSIFHSPSVTPQDEISTQNDIYYTPAKQIHDKILVQTDSCTDLGEISQTSSCDSLVFKTPLIEISKESETIS